MSTVGEQITLTATLSPVGSTAVDGTVNVESDGVVLDLPITGSGAVNSSGLAQFQTSAAQTLLMLVGIDDITATFVPDNPNFTGSVETIDDYVVSLLEEASAIS